ncbi:MAG: hypothetical protein WBW88_09870, partial [Rhodothermales bacterium]
MPGQANRSQRWLALRRLLNKLGWRGMGAFCLSLVGLALLILGGLVLFQGFGSKSRTLRITSGTDIEVREKMVQFLARKAGERNLLLQDVRSQGSLDALRKVERGEIDLAVVQAGLHLDSGTSVREVAPIDVERLHLLVRAEHWSAVSEDLKALRGKSVFLNYPGSGTNHLSRLLLTRVGLRVVPNAGKPSNDGVIVAPVSSHDILALLDSMQTADKEARTNLHSKMPDACFLIASLPSPFAWRLINEADYRLVPLPFTRALAVIS